jgi:hypothetical protein
MPTHDWRGLLPEGAVREATSQIFHYTTPAGLLGLVTGRELWATEASGMNDVSEVRQGWDFTRAWLADQDPEDALIRELLRVAQIGDNTQGQHPAQTRDGIFMCCASLRGDDANQWRLYAGSARGYAVELDPRVPLTTIVDGGRPRSEPTSSAPAGSEIIRRALNRVPVTPGCTSCTATKRSRPRWRGSSITPGNVATTYYGMPTTANGTTRPTAWRSRSSTMK